MSKLALKLIAKNVRSKSPELDLANCDLSKLPSELSQLVWLKKLHLGNIRFEGTLGGSIHRKTRNKGPANSSLKNINLLVNLPCLQVLSLSGTNVEDLTPLASLRMLQVLSLDITPVKDLSPLSQLNELQALSLESTAVSDLTPLSTLSELQKLYLSSSKVSDFGPLSGLHKLQKLSADYVSVKDLFPLSGLRELQNLYLSSTKVNDISPLSSLESLQVLSLDSTPVSDLSSLANLKDLQCLYLKSTQVRDLSPLTNLNALQKLSLSSTPVTDISPLSNLDMLKELFLDSTQVYDLSPLKSMLKRGRIISINGFGDVRVKNTPLLIPPLEIVAQGNAAILNYFRERDAGGVDYLYEAKMLILGEGSSGKTSLFRRLYKPNESLPSEHESTKGIDIYQHDFLIENGRSFRLNVWDFGGQEIYHATHQFFLTRRSLYLLLDDTRKDHKSVSDPGFKDWLDIIEMFGDDSPALIFQNEKAGRSKAIDMNGIQKKYPFVKDYFKGNLENSNAADILREAIVRYAATLPHIGEQLPAKWLKVRAEIEKRAKRETHITQKDYFDIYNLHLPADRTNALHLSRYFHDLGVFLHFQDDPLLTRIVILQNAWATRAVYLLLDDEIVKSKYGRFDRSDCLRIWQDSNYIDMHPELLALMDRFELCYQLPHCESPTWFAPQLLPPSKPSALVGWEKPEDLIVCFNYDFMPKGIISRLIVRQHRLTRDTGSTTDACLTSVLFSHNSSSALAELMPSGKVIEIRSRGPESKILLNVLANEIEEINKGFPGLHGKVKKMIPCACSACKLTSKPHMYDERDLMRRIDKKKFKVECPINYEEIDVEVLLDVSATGVTVKQPEWANKVPAPRTIRIFLASSKELLADRDAFELHFRQENDSYQATGQYLEIIRCESFLDSISHTRKQDDYNLAIKDCDIFVSLFATKVGKITEEEFDAAYAQFMTNGLPMVFTYFKEVQVGTTKAVREDMISLWSMRDKLAKLGHYHTNYQNSADLFIHFARQLKKMTTEGLLS